MGERRTGGMKSGIDCGVCARPLVYATEAVTRTCAFCGKEEKTLIYCPAGHYVCNSCHSKGALEVLREVLSNTKSKDPAAILERVMSHPAVPMHGPEHHAIVPGVLIAAVRNAGYTVPEGAIYKALERASKGPGGWCGLYGDCGAAVGVGVAVSVLTSATPLTGKQRTLALAATSFTLSRMLDEQPRCCKRASRTSIAAGTEFLRERLGIILIQGDRVKCAYTKRNQQCARENCPYFDEESNQTLIVNKEKT